ncbi:fructosamine kinase family protein [Kangiella sp. HZ709]|uniref:fructosamine kinase family protein n=1 Tax=Kangiella sp. HZ709 TaxID=2666328 RepID=UPI0012B00D50|nr:fructosamine kinase family protein [Kangiella sp. HZ709]MRX26914.1 phosphotransferase [Kangiella sp. HZ709]
MLAFIKTNDSEHKDWLIREAEGLKVLHQQLALLDNDFIKLPEVIEVNNQKLVLETINQQTPTNAQWFRFGESLAQLHYEKQLNYGFKTDNYIGRNFQKNLLSQDWGTFFFEYRLLYQVSLIQDKPTQESFWNTLDSKKRSIINLLNHKKIHPSLVHGDLWSGNVLFDEQNAWLIDPAVYYADREVDIAMSEMFGGFSQSFYDGYDAIYSRTDEYRQKKPIYNLYHYLNHYNLFGESYFNSCKNIIRAI